MTAKTIEVTCPGCGNTFAVPVKRHNKIGEGYYDAGKMTRLARVQLQVLHIIDEIHARDWEGGLTKVDLTFKVNEYRKAFGLPNIKGTTVSGALSVLQGLKILSCKPAEVTLVNADIQRFEHVGAPRWYRVGRSLLENQV